MVDPKMAPGPKAAKTRSPNYPAMSLEEALQRLRVIYDKQHRYPTTRDVLAKLLGYGGVNGASATVLSALGKYGLLEGHGEQLRVSEMGEDLVLYRKGDPQYDAALPDAALRPAFFRELRDQYPDGLPHEHSLRASLIKRGFNPKVIDSAVRAYRDTIEFVNAETDDSSGHAPEEPPSEGAMQTQQQQGHGTRRQPPPSPPDEPEHRAVALPLSANEWATLQAAFPLSETAWDQMLAVLNAMKPALVAPAAPGEAPQAAPDLRSNANGSDPAEREPDGE